MNIFVRSIKQENRLLGISPDKTSVEDYSGDLFAEFQTKNNTVSVWAIDDLCEVESVALALSSAGKSLDKMLLLILDKDSLISNCPHVRNSPENSETPYKAFREHHHDVESLNYYYLGKFAYCVILHYARNNLLTLYKDQIATILSNALKDNKINFDELDKNLRFELSSWITKHKDKSNFDTFGDDLKLKITNCLDKDKIKPCLLSKTCAKYRNK